MSGLWFKEAGVGGGVKDGVTLEAVRDDKGEEMGAIASPMRLVVCTRELRVGLCEHQYKEDDKKR